MSEAINVSTETSTDAWQARAAAWELMALSFRYPTDVLAQAVEAHEWHEAALEIANATGLRLPDAWDRGLSGATPCDTLRSLRIEATRLFVGAPAPVASPYEGIWRAEDDGVQPLLFVNPHTMDVERFMRSCGLGKPEGTNEPLDHVATECELMEHLAARAAADADDDGRNGYAPLVSASELPGGSAAAAYEAFGKEHVKTWMPRFAQAVQDETRHPFYRAASTFLSALVS